MNIVKLRTGKEWLTNRINSIANDLILDNDRRFVKIITLDHARTKFVIEDLEGLTKERESFITLRDQVFRAIDEIDSLETLVDFLSQHEDTPYGHGLTEEFFKNVLTTIVEPND